MKISSLFGVLIFGRISCRFFEIFLMVWGYIFGPFGAKMSPKCDQKLIRKMTSKKGGSREVRRRRGEAELGSRRANYQRGLYIKKVQLFEDSDIRRFGDSDIRYCIR